MRLCLKRWEGYESRMIMPSPPVASFAHMFAGLIVLGIVAGIGFALWLDHAPAIFMALVNSGLSWCF